MSVVKNGCLLLLQATRQEPKQSCVYLRAYLKFNFLYRGDNFRLTIPLGKDFLTT